MFDPITARDLLMGWRKSQTIDTSHFVDYINKHNDKVSIIPLSLVVEPKTDEHIVNAQYVIERKSKSASPLGNAWLEGNIWGYVPILNNGCVGEKIVWTGKVLIDTAAFQYEAMLLAKMSIIRSSSYPRLQPMWVYEYGSRLIINNRQINEMEFVLECFDVVSTGNVSLVKVDSGHN